MMKTSRERQNGGVSDANSQFPSRKEPLHESMGRLKIQDRVDDDKGGSVEEIEYPDRPGEPDCIYYLRTGKCSYGIRCRFNHPPLSELVIPDASEHPERQGQPECRYFLKTGTCKFGSACRYHHPQAKDREPILLNMLGLPMREDERQCRFYMLNGVCKFGILCKFDHPQPVPSGNNIPGYGSNGLTYLPSYAGGVSDLSMTKSTYPANPSLQAPPNYLPIVLPPQGWNRYMGIMNQSPIPAVLANPSSSNQLHVFSAPVPQHLPERPDQPECRDFVNHGTCKFGFECKFHHPRDKAPIMTNPSPFGTLVLSPRPMQGQAMYSNYVQYGPSGQFDHPWSGYAYNYLGGSPTTLPYQWNSPALLTAESSPSKPSKTHDVSKRGQSSNSRNNGDVQHKARSIEIHQHDDSE